MDTKLTSTFDRYRVYADQACNIWKQQNAETVLHSMLLPEYSKGDRLLNQARAMTGKWLLKTALKVQRPSAKLQSMRGSTSLWSLISKIGIHEWNKMFLPTHSPGKLDSTFFSDLAVMIESGMAGFEAWRTEHHPECSMAESEQASRVVWFALVWAVMQGRRELTTAELKATWSYAMLYPLVDNFLDSSNPADQENRPEFIKDLRSSLTTGIKPGSFSYHPKRSFLVNCMEEVSLAAAGQGPLVAEEVFGALEMLTVVESNRRLESIDEILFQTCMKGTLAIVPIATLVGGPLTPGQCKQLFQYGLSFQLLDDLQDMQVDSKRLPQTVFTFSRSSAANLDAAVTKTLNYMASPSFNATTYPMKSAEIEYFTLCVARIITYMTTEALLVGPYTHSAPYQSVKALKKYSPFSRRFMISNRFERSLHRVAQKL